MQKAHYDIVLFLSICTFLILLMAVFIVSILYLYRKKQLAYYRTIEELRLDYEKNLLHTQLEIQEQTLQHISEEIHDNINLSLTLAKLNLNTFDWSCLSKARIQINCSLEQVSKAIRDLSYLSRGLNSELIANQGLIEVLKSEVERLKELSLFQLNYTVTGTAVFMDSQKELVIFRIIQEAFNNIIKHAKATIVKLSLHYDMEELKILIADNGKGFNKEIKSDNNKSGAGLNNMNKRAKVLNGKTIIQSKPESGTSIYITIPY